jgi:hypothetical protein
VLALLVGAALGHGCDRRGAPAAEPRGTLGQGDEAAGARSHGLEEPPRLSLATLHELAARIVHELDLSDVPAEPSVGPVAPVLVEPDPNRVTMDRTELVWRIYETEPPEGARGKALQVAGDVPWRRLPTVHLAPNGVAAVRFETRVPIAGAGVYFGGVMPEDPLGQARYRRRAQGDVGNGQVGAHRVDFPVPALLRPVYDVPGILEAGRGHVPWRLEILDAATASARVHEGRLMFRCEPSCEGKGARFVQLPSVDLGPFVDDVTPDAATVSWTTDAATRGVALVYGSGLAQVRQVVSEAAGTRHEVRLGGLEADTRYRYEVLSVDRRGEWSLLRGGTFRTAPTVGDDAGAFTFAFLSDSRSGHGGPDERYGGTNRTALHQLLTQALRHEPRFVLFVGDLVDGYVTEPEVFRYELTMWQRAVQPFAAHVPFYEAMGNHEALLHAWEPGWVVGRSGDTSAEAVFAEQLVTPDNAPEAPAGAPPYLGNTYSFDWGPVHVAVINSNYFVRSHAHRADHPAGSTGQREGWVDDTTLAWLERDLSAARSRGQRHLLVATHEPGFPNGGHVGDGMYWDGKFPEVLERRDALFRLMARHGVAAVIHGDEHNYSRTRVDAGLVPGLERPLWQIVSGGAGAPYYAQDRTVPWAGNVERFDARQHVGVVRVSGERAEVVVMDSSGLEVDRFELTRAGR